MTSDYRFTHVLEELQHMHDRKGQDYGVDEDPYQNCRAAENLGIDAWKGVLIRMGDKMLRLSKAARTGKLTNESIEDSFIDLAVYGIIGLILYRETLPAEWEEPNALIARGPVPAGPINKLRVTP